MAETNVGFRVFGNGPRPDATILKRFENLDVVNIADGMHGMNCMDRGMRPFYQPIARVVGPAVTVSVTPGNGFMIRKAILLCGPGDVIVVNGWGNVERSVLGGSVMIAMKSQGVAGLVVDGVVRDIAEARMLGFPVYCRGANPRSGTDMSGRGEVNGPIACGGAAVLPGDIVVADEEGIVVVPSIDAKSVAMSAAKVQGVKGSIAVVDERVATMKPGRVANWDRIQKVMEDEGCVEVSTSWQALVGTP